MGVILRAYKAMSLDVFEDGYHHWYIAVSLRDSGVLEDGIGGMTGGNWLPLYYYMAAGMMLLTGSTSILLLKGLSIACSVVTMLFIFLIGERWRKSVGLLAAFLFALNPLDILLSSMSLPDSLALALLMASIYIIIFHHDKKAHMMAAGVLLAAAAATRYEVWAMLPVIFVFVMKEKSPGSLSLRWRAAAFIPSILFTVSWLAMHSMSGSLAGTVFGQTALQPAIVAERTGLGGLERAAMFWVLYGANEAVLLILAVAFFALSFRSRERMPPGLPMLSSILLVFTVLITILVGSGMMVGSYRYLSFTVVTVALAASLQLERMVRRPGLSKKPEPERRRRWTVAAGIVFILLIPSLQYSFDRADATSNLNEPQVRAGQWLRGHVPADGGLVFLDSPIVAYYSGLPPERMIGSASLPGDIAMAREHILANVDFIVFTDHPYFEVTKAFPELRQGRSTGNFLFLYSPNDWRIGYGAHPTYIYMVDRDLFTFPATGNLSARFSNSSEPAPGNMPALQKGAILVNDEIETLGEGAGFGVPALTWGGRTYYSSTARTEMVEGGISRTYVLDTIEEGPAYHPSYVTVVPAGEVRVLYRVNGPVLSVDADLVKIPRDSTLMMLNEQAGTVYSRFTDFDSYDTVADFSWKKVTGWYNYLLDPNGRGFRVDYTPDYYNGTTLWLGRRALPGGFDWAGLDYSVDLSSYDRDRFAYDIHIVEA